MGKHKGWSTWVARGRQVAKKCGKLVLERLDRKVVELTWENIRVGAICQKVMKFLNFRKKLQKNHFCVFAYVYGVYARSGRSKSQKCGKLHFLHFGAPESSKSHFFIHVRRFCPIWEAQIHFSHFWSKKVVIPPHGAPGGPIH